MVEQVTEGPSDSPWQPATKWTVDVGYGHDSLTAFMTFSRLQRWWEGTAHMWAADRARHYKNHTTNRDDVTPDGVVVVNLESQSIVLKTHEMLSNIYGESGTITAKTWLVLTKWWKYWSKQAWAIFSKVS
jgi:hypothetical protein